MSRSWTHERATYVSAVGPDREAADVVGFLFDLAAGHPGLRLRAGSGKRPTFLADVRQGKPGKSVFSVSPHGKRVDFVPSRVDALLSNSGADWFTNRLRETFDSALRVGEKEWYRMVSLADLGSRRGATVRLIEETMHRISPSASPKL